MQGVLLDGTIVAIKRLSSESKQGTREFTNEIGIMLSLQHPNIVKLHGLCEEDDQRLLIYEYMENSNLAHALFGNYFTVSKFYCCICNHLQSL